MQMDHVLLTSHTDVSSLLYVQGGKKDGLGTYWWPTGASYKGEWADGSMHGVGTFESPDGTRYQGGWAYDLKQGLGKKWFPNGDTYEVDCKAFHHFCCSNWLLVHAISKAYAWQSSCQLNHTYNMHESVLV